MSRAVAAKGLLRVFNDAGVIDIADVHPAMIAARLVDESDESVILACALALRTLRSGSVCLDVRAAATGAWIDDADKLADLPWPEPELWLQLLGNSALVGDGSRGSPALLSPESEMLQDSSTTSGAISGSDTAFVMRSGLLYTSRAWRQQEVVRDALLLRHAATPPRVDEDALRIAAAQNHSSNEANPEQFAAVENAVRGLTSVIAGGPGTGKTTVIARVLEALALQPEVNRVALAAPTGRAAARMTQLLEGSQTSLRVSTLTLHSLLGSLGPNRGFTHSSHNPLPYDCVVVDEMSMVSLDMMATLLGAVRPTTRLILVGDPDQLASVDAGSVLADIAAANLTLSPSQSGSMVTRLTQRFRFSGSLAALAEAVRTGDADEALHLLAPNGLALDGDHQAARLIDRDPVTASEADLADIFDTMTCQAGQMQHFALHSDVTSALKELSTHQLLCAHRDGPYGVSTWQRRLEAHLRSRISGYGKGEWYPGRPILVTANQPALDLNNGDQGVVVMINKSPQACFATPEGFRAVPPSLLSRLPSAHALTIHKSQGGQSESVTVILPSHSALLNRELLYTAITRAQNRVTIVGTEQALRQAIRTPANRASGLEGRLKDQTDWS